MKNPPDDRGHPLKKFEKKLQKSKCTRISITNLKGKVSDTKNIVTALVFYCNNLYGTPCISVEESGAQVCCAHSLLLFHHKCHLIPPALHVMVLVVKGFFEEKP